MTNTRYCYHCGKSHPVTEMRPVTTKAGTKWRCITSIQAIKKTVAERDAFGKKVSAMNTEAWSATVKARTSKVLS